MELQGSSLRMVSANIARLRVENHGDLAALADELLEAEKRRVSGVIAASNVQGRLIEKNTLKHGRMVYFPTASDDPRITAHFDFLLAQARAYLQATRKGIGGRIDPDDLQMERSWIVDQRADDYQILHAHLPNVLSGIIYLEVPEGINRSTYPDGILTLLDGQPSIITPAAGDMYIWPAYMLHHVNPFRGPGRRLAISFNILDAKHRHLAPVYFTPNYVEVSPEQYFGKRPLPPVPYIDRNG